MSDFSVGTDYMALRPDVPTEAEHDLLSQTASWNLSVAMSLRATAWRLAESGLRTFCPELSEDEVQAEVRAQFRRATG